MGKVISLEGIHGCGKSTQGRLLLDSLESRGRKVMYISSSEKPLSAYCMRFLEENGAQDANTLFFLSLSNNNSLRRTLEGEGIFIVDRYVHTDMASTLAAGGDLNWIRGSVSQLLMPDYTFMFNVPPEEAYERKRKVVNALEEGLLIRGEEESGFVEYQRKIGDAYLLLAESEARMHILDGTKSKESIHNEVMGALLRDGLL